MKKIKLLAFFLAILTAVLMYLFLNQFSENRSSGDNNMVQVIVATSDLKANAEITQEQISVIELPEISAHKSSFNKAEDVLGKYVLSDIHQGEQIISSKIINSVNNVSFGLGYTLEKGKRAVSLMVEFDSGVSGLLKIGNKVDVVVVAHSNSNSSSNKGTLFSKYALQNVKIIAVESIIDKGSESTYSSVTLELTPEEALELELQKIYAQENGGRFSLILRPQFDNERTADIRKAN